jgi:hypothetical protein
MPFLGFDFQWHLRLNFHPFQFPLMQLSGQKPRELISFAFLSLFFISSLVCVSLWLAAFCLTKSLVCKCCYIFRDTIYFKVFVLETCFSKFKEDSVQFPSQKKSDPKTPSGRPSHAFGCPLVSTVQACIHPDVSATCPDALQSSKRIQRSSVSFRTPVSVRQVKGFPSQTQLWEDSCNCPDDRFTLSRRYPW